MGQTEQNQGCDLLVVIAHPDDEIFTSGVICLCGDKGWKTTIVCVTDGEGGSLDRLSASTADALGEVRRAELDASAQVLGVGQVLRLHQGDLAEPLSPGGWNVSAVSASLADILRANPSAVVLTHGPMGGYGNKAHTIVHRCVMAAAEETAFAGPIYSFCGKTPGAFFSWHLDEPSDLVFDVTSAFTRRCDSLSQHYSQIDYFIQPHRPRTLRKLLSALVGYTLSTTSFGRKRIPIGTAARFFERFPLEGLVRQRPAAAGSPDRLVELFLDDDRVRLGVKGVRRQVAAEGLALRSSQHD